MRHFSFPLQSTYMNMEIYMVVVVVVVVVVVLVVVVVAVVVKYQKSVQIMLR